LGESSAPTPHHNGHYGDYRHGSGGGGHYGRLDDEASRASSRANNPAGFPRSRSHDRFDACFAPAAAAGGAGRIPGGGSFDGGYLREPPRCAAESFMSPAPFHGVGGGGGGGACAHDASRSLDGSRSGCDTPDFYAAAFEHSGGGHGHGHGLGGGGGANVGGLGDHGGGGGGGVSGGDGGSGGGSEEDDDGLTWTGAMGIEKVESALRSLDR
tara:strand:- start:449 stop:1084 length:636 start_codon:yes stop_codon:yes gene_type:complete